ncbi:MAG: M23 family metallopeptidase [Candidatus Krumholzibacteriia bacterium]
MRLKKHYDFLYVPEDHAGTRQFRVRRGAIVGAAVAVGLLAVTAAAYVTGLVEGSSWRPGGSPLAHENRLLRGEVDRLVGDVDLLRGDMKEIFQIQGLLARAADLEPLDAVTFQAGVGGRGPLEPGGAAREAAGLLGLTAAGRTAQLERDLDLLLRQARIQRQGFEAILDTLTARSTARRHIPSIRPCDIGWLSSRYGLRQDPFTGQRIFHRGVDFSLPLGSPVRVTGDGTVVAVQRQRGLGKLVKVDHGGGVTTIYGHLGGVLVEKGQQVSRGDVIAESGNSGRSTGPHLHYEIRVDGRAVNPLSYILDSYARAD